jgi:hypothetical protein
VNAENKPKSDATVDNKKTKFCSILKPSVSCAVVIWDINKKSGQRKNFKKELRMDPEMPNIHANRYNDTRKPGQAQFFSAIAHSSSFFFLLISKRVTYALFCPFFLSCNLIKTGLVSHHFKMINNFELK